MLNIEKEELKDSYIGLVKWFGGFNHQKNKENDYGFIQSMSGEDVFVHISAIKSGVGLSEGELVIFEFGEKDGRWFAKNLYRTINKPKKAKDFINIYSKNKDEYSNFFNSSTFKNSFKELINEVFIEQLDEKEFLHMLQNVYDGDHQFLFNQIDNYL